MNIKQILIGSVLLFSLASAQSASAQGRPDPATLIAAQQKALAPLSWMDGIWRGPAWTILGDGTKHNVMQTERIGPFLDGSVKILEGRGYDEATGKVSFNAFGTVSYNPATQSYSLHSYAQGFSGDFRFTPTADGYVWEIPAGPMTIRYTAVIKDGAWREVGHQIMSGKDPVQFFEMNLKRVSNTDWPAAGAVPMK